MRYYAKRFSIIQKKINKDNQYEGFENDIVLASFINYMKLALYHRKLNYFRKMKLRRDKEVSIDELKEKPSDNSEIEIEFPIEHLLNDKERYLLELRYKYGLNYKEISTITNESVYTLWKRRERAVDKIKKVLEDWL